MYLACAFLLLASMRKNERVLMYFGFLNGAISKAIFLLFCAGLVFPSVPAETKVVPTDETGDVNDEG